MMNLDEVIKNFSERDDQLAERVKQAAELRALAEAGDITRDELVELLEDLKRLDNIELSADELDQAIAFNECLEAIAKIPLP
jgi:cell division FtsZ-interacting protein ZapD